MEFNEKLQQLRKQQNLTQEKLAEMLYVSRTAISKWESGRGYPSIDSLKAISKLFSISVDDLLSNEELISLAENENRENTRSICTLVFGILDCMTAILFFLPLFAQRGGDKIQQVSLLALAGITNYMRIIFILIVALTAIFGIAQLALQNYHHRIWLKNNVIISLFLNAVGTMIFIASLQSYVAAFMLCMLVAKIILYIKRQ